MIRNDRKIAIALLLLAVAFAAFFWKFGDYEADTSQMAADSIFSQKKNYHTNRPVRYYATESQHVERFPFDPNTADSWNRIYASLMTTCLHQHSLANASQQNGWNVTHCAIQSR